MNREFHLRCEVSSGLYAVVAKLEFFPVVLFIGSDKVVGDSLAPICGSMLKKAHPKCLIYGDIANPVNAKNLEETVKFIKLMHPHHKILVVDASIGDEADVGKIKFIQSGIHPGKAVGREFQMVGDFAIAGIVACKNSTTGSISPVRLFHAYKMAEEIAREIYLCSRSFHQSRKQIEPPKSKLEGIYP